MSKVIATGTVVCSLFNGICRL